LKNFLVIILSFLLLSPQSIQAHTDIVVDNSELEFHHADNDEMSHQEEHHQNDSEEEKNTEHHHHCSVVNISNTFIKEEIEIQFIDLYFKKDKIFFYKKFHTSDYLDRLFQPPRLV
jgi:hypothetical protein